MRGGWMGSGCLGGGSGRSRSGSSRWGRCEGRCGWGRVEVRIDPSQVAKGRAVRGLGGVCRGMCRSSAVPWVRYRGGGVSSEPGLGNDGDPELDEGSTLGEMDPKRGSGGSRAWWPVTAPGLDPPVQGAAN